MEIQLIYGPNGSGKSKYAEDVAVAAGEKRVYLATMVPQNEENQLRIAKHRKDLKRSRWPGSWRQLQRTRKR